MKNNILKSLIFSLILTAVTMVPVSAEELEETISLSVSPLFTVTKRASSIETATINPETGIHSGLQTVYDIVTNGTDSDYDITISSAVNCDSGVVSAYGGGGTLLFTNEAILPSEAAIKNAKLALKQNDNVIAYPVSATITSPMTTKYYSGYGTYGSCYVIELNGATSSTFTFSILGTPVTNTYSNTNDQAGAYRSTITFTVTPKV